MTWEIKFLPEAQKDLQKLDGSQRILVVKALAKVSQNPLPDYEGGYGKPLGNKDGNNLAGFLKIKLRNAGLRIVYHLMRTESEMYVVVIGARSDEAVYNAARRRIEINNL